MIVRSRFLKAHPASLVLASFLFAIFVGTLLLKLPLSVSEGENSWMDALFTATSAVCVTGLIVVDTGTFYTRFGQCVILGLIQVGGLGVMTLSVILFRWLGRTISFRQRLAMQDIFAHTPREDILSLVKSVIGFTLAFELAGTLLLTAFWAWQYPLPTALYHAVFHSISAFCNAGFALFPDSMTPYAGNLLLNATIATLIVFGGIGFPVLHELVYWMSERKKRRIRLSIHTKTVLTTSVLLTISGAVLFAFLERYKLSQISSVWERLFIPLFQSITCRTAGFNTTDIGSLKDATLATMLILMFFGASPGSCGGGVKTTTFALLAAFTWSRVRRQKRVTLFRKSIPVETITRSMSLVLVSVGIVTITMFLLLVGDSASGHEVASTHGSFLAYLFETISAFGTVGLSMGITSDLDLWGKFWIVLLMILGRVGVLTFSYIVVGSGTTGGIEHSEENLMIG